MAYDQSELLQGTLGAAHPEDANRRARYYLLTAAGQRELARERVQWERSSSAVNWVLDWQGGLA